jgi:hypothetical protein
VGTSSARHRPREQDALPHRAPVVRQESPLLLGLDALGERRRPQALRQLDDRADHAAGVRVVREVADECPVDLQDVHAHVLQPRQRRVAGPEVVQRQPEARGSQLAQDPLRAVGVDRRGRLDDLDHDAGRIEVSQVHQLGDLHSQVGLEELARREVEAHVGLHLLPAPRGRLPAESGRWPRPRERRTDVKRSAPAAFPLERRFSETPSGNAFSTLAGSPWWRSAARAVCPPRPQEE